jgi:hypothetical protein
MNDGLEIPNFASEEEEAEGGFRIAKSLRMALFARPVKSG